MAAESQATRETAARLCEKGLAARKSWEDADALASAEALFRRATVEAPDLWMAHLGLGELLTFRSARVDARLCEGVRELHLAGVLAPTSREPSLVLASVLAPHDIGAATQFYEHAIQEPTVDSTPTHFFPLSWRAGWHWAFAIQAAEAGFRSLAVNAFRRALGDESAPEYRNYFISLPLANDALEVARQSNALPSVEPGTSTLPKLPAEFGTSQQAIECSTKGALRWADPRVMPFITMRNVLAAVAGMTVLCVAILLMFSGHWMWIGASVLANSMLAVSAALWLRSHECRMREFDNTARRLPESEDALFTLLKGDELEGSPAVFWLGMTSVCVLLVAGLTIAAIGATLFPSIELISPLQSLLLAVFITCSFALIVISIFMVGQFWGYHSHFKAQCVQRLRDKYREEAHPVLVRLEAWKKRHALQRQLIPADALWFDRTTCFFCEENPAHPEANVHVQIWGDLRKRRTTSVAAADKRYDILWRTANVAVPRCTTCRNDDLKFERRSLRWALTTSAVIFVVAILGAVASYMIWGATPLLTVWLVSLVVGPLIGAFAAGALYHDCHRQHTSHIHRHPGQAKDFPLLRGLNQLGWHLGAVPSAEQQAAAPDGTDWDQHYKLALLDAMQDQHLAEIVRSNFINETSVDNQAVQQFIKDASTGPAMITVPNAALALIVDQLLDATDTASLDHDASGLGKHLLGVCPGCHSHTIGESLIMSSRVLSEQPSALPNVPPSDVCRTNGCGMKSMTLYYRWRDSAGMVERLGRLGLFIDSTPRLS